MNEDDDDEDGDDHDAILFCLFFSFPNRRVAGYVALPTSRVANITTPE